MLNRKSISAVIAVVVLFCAMLNRDARADFQPGEFITYSQESWGAAPSPGNAAQLLADRFDIVYGFGAVEVGISGSAGFSMIFTWAGAVLDYLPSTGSPAPLNADLLDETSSSSGVFGGHVLALQLDADFNDAGYLNGSAGIPFGDLLFHDMVVDFGGFSVDMTAFNGLTVRQFVADMNIRLAGGGGPYTYDDVAALTDEVTRSFQGGTPSQFAQDHLRVVPEPGDVNFDGVVDIFDVNLVSAHWGEAGPTGDANGDGTVDIFDINLISSNWTPTGGAITVPEPSSLLLGAFLLLGATFGWKRRWRH